MNTKLLPVFHTPFLFVILVHITFSTIIHTTVAQNDTNVVVGDRLALLDIKSMIRYDPQGVMTSWNDLSANFCQWKGVTCGPRHQRVTVLDLKSSNLLGSLSPSIGNLTFLRRIRLQNNSFSGDIPSSIGRLFRLQELRLYNNSFTGNIPYTLSNCTNLQVLHLGYNKLTGRIPDFIGSLSMLNILILHGNVLEGGIPRSIGNLTFLETLSLAECQLGGTVPDVFHRLTNLSRLALPDNNLVGNIPPSLFNVTTLTQVFLDNNHLTGRLPSNLGFIMPGLEALSLPDNRLTGPLPSSLLSLPQLAVLDVARNNLSGKLVISPRETCNFLTLSLSSNRFGSGDDDEMKFIDDLSICRGLQVLNLGSNQLRGLLPQTLGKICGVLEGLILKGNQLHGEVPSSLSKCQSLKILDVGNNHLNDTFPHWLGSLPNLRVIVLKSNNFHGTIETSSTIKLPFPSLRILDISRNRFSGQLPRKYFQNFNAIKNVVGRSTKAEYFYYSITLVIKGKDQYFSKIFVEYSIIDVSSNRFEGQIPYILGSLDSLIVLNLSHNTLTGEIPHALGDLSEIESLDLSCNQLTGEIPHNLADLTFLAYLNLSQNHLTGRIPSGKQFNTFSSNSFGGNPKLCGQPLPEKCNKSPHKPHIESDGDAADKEESEFTWRVVMLGYGCGTLIGLVMGYLMMSTGRPIWFNAIVDAGEQMIFKRQNRRIYSYIGR